MHLNKDYIKYQKLQAQLHRIQGLCAQQYFAIDKCQGAPGHKCKNQKLHVERFQYPCIHYFTGNCKYGMNCHFSHHIRRQIPRPTPNQTTCKKLYFQNNCPAGGKCKFSHNLKQYPCYYNTISKCRFSDQECRYAHDKLIDAPIICFFDLMKGCNKTSDDCPNVHAEKTPANFLTYDGPL